MPLQMAFYVSTVQPGSITLMFRKIDKVLFLPAVTRFPAELTTVTFDVDSNVMKES